MQIKDPSLDKINLEQLIARIDASDIKTEDAAQILGHIAKPDFGTPTNLLTTDLIENAMVAPPATKDLIVLGLLLRAAGPLTAADLGRNLQETLEKLPREKQLMQNRLNELQGGAVDMNVFEKNVPIQSFDTHPAHARRDPDRDRPLRRTVRPGDKPTAFVIVDGEVRLRVIPAGEDRYEDLRERAVRPFAAMPSIESNTEDVTLSGVPTKILEHALSLLPGGSPRTGVVNALEALVTPNASMKVRDAIVKELESRKGQEKDVLAWLCGGVGGKPVAEFDRYLAELNREHWPFRGRAEDQRS